MPTNDPWGMARTALAGTEARTGRNLPDLPDRPQRQDVSRPQRQDVSRPTIPRPTPPSRPAMTPRPAPLPRPAMPDVPSVSLSGQQAPVDHFNYQVSINGQPMVYPPGVAAPTGMVQVNSRTPLPSSEAMQQLVRARFQRPRFSMPALPPPANEAMNRFIRDQGYPSFDAWLAARVAGQLP